MGYTNKQLNEIYKNVKLAQWGYRKFGLNLPPTTIDQGASGLRAVEDKEYVPIFLRPRDDESEMEIDSSRMQCNHLVNLVNGSWFGQTIDHLQQELDCIYPDLEICFVSALKSVAGGPQQGFHADFGHHEVEGG